jgi:beta-glucosidase
MTFEKRWEDNPAHNSYYPEAGTRRVVYRSGIFVGYRGYEHNGTQPLFPFGYGLSYTTFKYGDLNVKPLDGAGKYEVSFDVTNTGKREGAEVAQVYVGANGASVPHPPKELKAFSKVTLKPGETKRVSVELDPRSFAYFDVPGKQWKADAGDYEVLVGHSSAEIELRRKVKLERALAIAVGE